MKFIFIALVSLFQFPAFAATDFLAQETIRIESTRSSEVLSKTLADPKAVFNHFELALDSSTKIVRPLVVSGPANHPVVQVSIQKCVAFVCQTVDMDMSITVREGRGGCDRTFRMRGDLSRSSASLRDVYDLLDVMVCYTAAANGTGSLQLTASVNQGPKYSQGMIQGEILKLMKLQVTPIVKAINITLKEKETRR